MLRRTFLYHALTILCLVFGAMAEAQAHSFKVGFIAPLSGPEMENGQQALQAMLLAADERDRHPDNASDGHLGGLDVYIRKVNTNQPEAALLSDIQRSVINDDIQFISGLIPDSIRQSVIDQLREVNVPYIDTPVITVTDLTMMDGGSFAESFTRRFDYSPNLSALQGYRIARILDQVVRAIDGDFSDPARIKEVIKKVVDADE